MDGDSPLVKLAEFSGHVHAMVDVIAYPSGEDTSGSFVLSGVPSGATVLGAWVLVTSFDPVENEPVSVTFAGQDRGTRLPDVQDTNLPNVFSCTLYRFDVTDAVAGDGVYAYQATGNYITYGVALVVVVQHDSFPSRRIVIADGAESLQHATSTCDLGHLPAATGELTVFTAGDDTLFPFGESIALDGVTVAGPGDLFDANQGDFASLVTVPVTTQAGANSFSVTTQYDWFGLHLAVLELDSDVILLGFETEDDGVTPLANGQDITPGNEFGNFVEIRGFPHSGLTAAIFDSDVGGPNDPCQDLDLLVGQGNLLILQERPQQSAPGIYDRPNDDAGGGRFEIGFRGREVTTFSIDLVDIDTGTGTASLVELFDAAGRARRYTVPHGWTGDLVVNGPPGVRTLDLTTLDPQPGFASTATATQDPNFAANRVVSMKVWLGGSGAIDNLSFSATTP